MASTRVRHGSATDHRLPSAIHLIVCGCIERLDKDHLNIENYFPKDEDRSQWAEEGLPPFCHMPSGYNRRMRELNALFDAIGQCVSTSVNILATQRGVTIKSKLFQPTIPLKNAKELAASSIYKLTILTDIIVQLLSQQEYLIKWVPDSIPKLYDICSCLLALSKWDSQETNKPFVVAPTIQHFVKSVKDEQSRCTKLDDEGDRSHPYGIALYLQTKVRGAWSILSYPSLNYSDDRIWGLHCELVGLDEAISKIIIEGDLGKQFTLQSLCTLNKYKDRIGDLSLTSILVQSIPHVAYAIVDIRMAEYLYPVVKTAFQNLQFEDKLKIIDVVRDIDPNNDLPKKIKKIMLDMNALTDAAVSTVCGDRVMSPREAANVLSFYVCFNLKYCFKTMLRKACESLNCKRIMQCWNEFGQVLKYSQRDPQRGITTPLACAGIVQLCKDILSKDVFEKSQNRNGGSSTPRDRRHLPDRNKLFHLQPFIKGIPEATACTLPEDTFLLLKHYAIPKLTCGDKEELVFWIKLIGTLLANGIDIPLTLRKPMDQVCWDDSWGDTSSLQITEDVQAEAKNTEDKVKERDSQLQQDLESIKAGKEDQVQQRVDDHVQLNEEVKPSLEEVKETKTEEVVEIEEKVKCEEVVGSREEVCESWEESTTPLEGATLETIRDDKCMEDVDEKGDGSVKSKHELNASVEIADEATEDIQNDRLQNDTQTLVNGEIKSEEVHVNQDAHGESVPEIVEQPASQAIVSQTGDETMKLEEPKNVNVVVPPKPLPDDPHTIHVPMLISDLIKLADSHTDLEQSKAINDSVVEALSSLCNHLLSRGLKLESGVYDWLAGTLKDCDWIRRCRLLFQLDVGIFPDAQPKAPVSPAFLRLVHSNYLEKFVVNPDLDQTYGPFKTLMELEKKGCFDWARKYMDEANFDRDKIVEGVAEELTALANHEMRDVLAMVERILSCNKDGVNNASNGTIVNPTPNAIIICGNMVGKFKGLRVLSEAVKKAINNSNKLTQLSVATSAVEKLTAATKYPGFLTEHGPKINPKVDSKKKKNGRGSRSANGSPKPMPVSSQDRYIARQFYTNLCLIFDVLMDYLQEIKIDLREISEPLIVMQQLIENPKVEWEQQNWIKIAAKVLPSPDSEETPAEDVIGTNPYMSFQIPKPKDTVDFKKFKELHKDDHSTKIPAGELICGKCKCIGHVFERCPEMECSKCHKSGHTCSVCPNCKSCHRLKHTHYLCKEVDDDGLPKEPSNLLCPYCHTKGHYAKDCSTPREQFGHVTPECEEPRRQLGHVQYNIPRCQQCRRPHLPAIACPVQCYDCSQTGHVRRNCPNKSPNIIISKVDLTRKSGNNERRPQAASSEHSFGVTVPAMDYANDTTNSVCLSPPPPSVASITSPVMHVPVPGYHAQPQENAPLTLDIASLLNSFANQNTDNPFGVPGISVVRDEVVSPPGSSPVAGYKYAQAGSPFMPPPSDATLFDAHFPPLDNSNLNHTPAAYPQLMNNKLNTEAGLNSGDYDGDMEYIDTENKLEHREQANVNYDQRQYGYPFDPKRNVDHSNPHRNGDPSRGGRHTEDQPYPLHNDNHRFLHGGRGRGGSGRASGRGRRGSREDRSWRDGRGMNWNNRNEDHPSREDYVESGDVRAESNNWRSQNEGDRTQYSQTNRHHRGGDRGRYDRGDRDRGDRGRGERGRGERGRVDRGRVDRDRVDRDRVDRGRVDRDRVDRGRGDRGRGAGYGGGSTNNQPKSPERPNPVQESASGESRGKKNKARNKKSKSPKTSGRNPRSLQEHKD